MRREQMDGDTEMTEETAVRIAEALESIKDAIWLIGGLAICSTIFCGVAIIAYILLKD